MGWTCAEHSHVNDRSLEHRLSCGQDRAATTGQAHPDRTAHRDAYQFKTAGDRVCGRVHDRQKMVRALATSCGRAMPPLHTHTIPYNVYPGCQVSRVPPPTDTRDRVAYSYHTNTHTMSCTHSRRLTVLGDFLAISRARHLAQPPGGDPARTARHCIVTPPTPFPVRADTQGVGAVAAVAFEAPADCEHT